MKAVIFRGKVDGSVRNVCFKVVLTDSKIDLLLMFLMPEKEQIRGISLIAKCSIDEQFLPMNFVPGTCYYLLEIYGLQMKTGKTVYYDFVSYKRRRFTVGKSIAKEDLIFVLRFDDPSSYFPLSFAIEEKFDINLKHKPVSTYTISGACSYVTRKTFIITLKQPESRLNFFFHNGKKLKYKIPFDLPAGRHCDIKVIVGFSIFENDGVCILGTEVSSRVVSFKTFFTKIEYQTLYNKTTMFKETLQGKFHTVEFIYRNKSEMYFASIMEYHDGIMKPYTKDYNGDPYSVINGCIDGLFFSTALDFHTLKPPPESLYGPVRLHIEASALVTPNLNIYFADFYCHYQVHYVTIILTPKWSPVDKFCQERLLKLDINKNPFIYLAESSEDFYEVKVYLGTGLRVEIFYTEPINIPILLRNRKGFFSRVPIIGRGESRPQGIPKNKQCKVCNI